jgi:GT2 family glycosyltransferase
MLIHAPRPPVAGVRRSEPPTFSVMVCAYQAADTIGAALGSLLAQTFPPQEIIVVDDGSTDGLSEVLAEYEGRIRLISQPHRGVASARNTALAAASGEFLTTLDADDTYDRHRLEALAFLACERPDLDLLATDTAFVIGDRRVGTFSAGTPFAIDDQRCAILQACFVGCNPAVRLEKLRSVGGFDQSLRAAEDWDCWLRVILTGSQAGMVDAPYYLYHLHSGSLTANRAESLRYRVQMLEKAERHCALKAEERPVLRSSIREHGGRALNAETWSRLRGETPRRRLLRSALVPNRPARARAHALLAIAAPGLARSVLVSEPSPAMQLGASAE